MAKATASIPITVSVGEKTPRGDGITDEEIREALANGNGVHDESPLDRSPLFSGFDVDEEQEIDHIVITRIKPVREGDLGQIPADTDEDFVREEYGGGTYQLQGRTRRKRPVKGAYRTIDLAGDPIFRSDTARQQWEQIKIQKFGKPEARAGASVTPIRSVEDQNVLEQDRHQRELARIKAESEAYALRARADLDLAVAKAQAEGAAAVARAKAESDAAVARAKAESEEREKRDRAFYEAQQKQQNEFMVAIKGQEKAGDPLQQLKAMSGILADLRSDNDGHAPDAVTALIENMPGIIGAVDSATGNTNTRRPAAGGSSASKKAAAADGEEPVTLTDTLAEKARAAARHLAKQGIKNPAAALSQQMERTFDRVLKAPAVLEGGKGRARPAAKGSKKK